MMIRFVSVTKLLVQSSLSNSNKINFFYQKNFIPQFQSLYNIHQRPINNKTNFVKNLNLNNIDISNQMTSNNLINKRFISLNSIVNNQETLNQKIEQTTEKTSQEQTSNDEKPKKKQSKFKMFYSQYGPMFLVVHLTTVVMWIYGFFLISKQ